MWRSNEREELEINKNTDYKKMWMQVRTLFLISIESMFYLIRDESKQMKTWNNFYSISFGLEQLVKLFRKWRSSLKQLNLEGAAV